MVQRRFVSGFVGRAEADRKFHIVSFGCDCRCEDGAFGRGDQTAGLGMLFGIIHHREWEWWLLSSLSVRSFLLSYYGTMSHDNIIY